MYVKQTCNIELAGKYRLRGLHSCEIKKSVHQIVQSTKIELPLSVLFQNNELLERVKLTDKIKEGDSIKIDLGYDGKNRTEFTGYIKKINTKIPLVLECEDEMYLFRKVYFTKNFKKATLKEVLQFIIQKVFNETGLSLELYKNMPQLTVTNFMLNNCNGIEALQGLADTYPMLSSFLIDVEGKKVLYCGLIYGFKKAEIKYKLNANTISNDELKYDEKDQAKHRVKIVNFKPDGTKEEFTYGDKKDTEVTFTYNSSHSHAELKLLADAELLKRVTGYRGIIETFLIPNVEPGNIAKIDDGQFNRTGTGYIGTVTTTFGSGARRKPEIDISL